MKFKVIYLVLVASFFMGCSPRYEVKKSYDSSRLDKRCANTCEKGEIKCQSKCDKSYDSCLVKAQKRAQMMLPNANKNYQQALNAYNNENYAYKREMQSWKREYANYEDDYRYYQSRCKNASDNKYECDKKSYLASKLDNYRRTQPQKPTIIKRVTLSDMVVEEQNKCSRACGCEDRYDRCFSKCGGEIIYEKFCVENCKETKR